jgi:hypothetical protein
MFYFDWPVLLLSRPSVMCLYQRIEITQLTTSRQTDQALQEILYKQSF